MSSTRKASSDLLNMFRSSSMTMGIETALEVCNTYSCGMSGQFCISGGVSLMHKKLQLEQGGLDENFDKRASDSGGCNDKHHLFDDVHGSSLFLSTRVRQIS